MVVFTNKTNIQPKTTLPELRPWISIVLLMGGTHVNNIRDYWSGKDALRNVLIARTMTLRRYEQLSRYLRCADPDTSPFNWLTETSRQRADRYQFMRCNPCFSVQLLWDTVALNCRTKWNALREISIDEAMVM